MEETNKFEENVKRMEQANSHNLELYNKVVDSLKRVYDPEIPVNIWELGLVYDIKITEVNEVVVLMTLTAPNCPEAESIPQHVDYYIRNLHGVTGSKVILTFDPPWDPSRMSEAAKLELGMF